MTEPRPGQFEGPVASPVTIAVVSAGMRSPSTTRLLADDLGEQVRRALGGQAEVVSIELRQHAHALADAMLTGFPTGELKTAIEQVLSADALVVVTPTFSATFSGLFKSFFDVIEPDALAGMPVLLAATGGTERHSLMLEHAMRPLFTYLGAVPVRTGVYAATSDFGGPGSARLAERVARAARELADAVRGGDPARAPRSRAGGASDDELVTPFTELLGRLG